MTDVPITPFLTPERATDIPGDFDGDVDGADFVVWQTHFPTTPAQGVAPVPEPASVLLASLAAGFALVRWRAKR